MNCILFCEGETDQIILSEYCGNRFGFHYCRNKTLQSLFPETGFHYENSSHNLDIVFSRGHQFEADISKALSVNKLNTDFFYDHIIVITDHDSDEEVQQVWENVKAAIMPFAASSIQLMENKWITVSQNIGFEQIRDVSFLLLSIPIEGEGALETFLLNALEKEKGNSFLAVQARQFVGKIIQQKDTLSEEIFNPKYLKQRRMQVKAPLAVFFALAWPDRSFEDIQFLMKRIPWEKYVEIQTVFKELEVLKSK